MYSDYPLEFSVLQPLLSFSRIQNAHLVGVTEDCLTLLTRHSSLVSLSLSLKNPDTVLPNEKEIWQQFKSLKDLRTITLIEEGGEPAKPFPLLSRVRGYLDGSQILVGHCKATSVALYKLPFC